MDARASKCCEVLRWSALEHEVGGFEARCVSIEAETWTRKESTARTLNLG